MSNTFYQRKSDGHYIVDPEFFDVVQELARQAVGVDAAAVNDALKRLGDQLAALIEERVGTHVTLPVNVTLPEPSLTRKTIEHDAEGRIVAVVEEVVRDA